MARKKIFSRLNRWWSGQGEPPPDEAELAEAEENAEEGLLPGSDAGTEGMDQASGNAHLSETLPPEENVAHLPSLVAELEQLKGKLEKKNHHLENLLQQRNEIHQQWRHAQDTIAALEAKLQEHTAAAEASVAAKMEAYEETLRQLHSEREARLRALEAEATERTQALEDARSRAEQLNQRVTGLEQQLQSSRPEPQEAELAREEAKRALSRAAQAEEAQKRAEERVVALEEALERARTLRSELEHSHEEAQRALALAVEADEARKHAEQRVAALQAELAERQALVENLQQAALSSPQPAPETPVPDSVDLTGEWEQMAAAFPQALESELAPPAPPSQFAMSEPVLSATTADEAGEPVGFEILPAPLEAPEEPPPPQQAEEPPERAKKLVLVAEDDPGIRRLIELALQKSGFDIITAEDGEEAFQKAVTERPNAILTDIMMPRMDGMELTSKLKKTPATSRIPIGFLTAQRELEYYKGALEMGSTLYVTKPFRPDNLLMMVNLLLSGKKKPRRGRK